MFATFERGWEPATSTETTERTAWLRVSLFVTGLRVGLTVVW